jgi:hypothetical protein
MLLLLAYELIAGIPGNVYWEMVATTCLSAAVYGDAVILLVYDARWRSTVREIVGGKSFRSSSMATQKL